MLHCITTLSMDDIREAFLRKISWEKSGSLLKPVQLVVPNRDTGRWLQLQQARQNGISANLDIELPARFIHRLNLSIDPQYEARLPNKFRLGWMIYHLLAGDQTGAFFPKLDHYVKHRRSSEAEVKRRRYQLAVQIADIFDQYQLFRPGWISAWSDGKQPDDIAAFSERDQKTAEWQMKLWLELRKSHPEFTSRPELHFKLLESIRSGEIAVPGPIHLIGTGSMPPMYAEVLAAISKTQTVFWYRIDPEQPGRGENVSSHELFKLSGLEHEQSREQLRHITALTDDDSEEYIEPEQGVRTNTLLGKLQDDVHQRRERPLSADESLRIHACHNPLREIEVLKDEIIQFFQDYPDAGPSDVLVTAPQLSDHITAVHAVFGRQGDDDPGMPYHIHDPSSTLTGRLFELLTDLMLIHHSRYKASQVLELMEREPVRERFDLHTADISLIRHWLKEAGVRWGLDAGDRGDEGIRSWEFGLNRLLMGVMQPPESESVVLGIVPFTDIEGSDQLRLAGVLSGIASHLKNWLEIARDMQTIATWKTHIHTLIDAFLPDEDRYEQAVLPVRRAVEALDAAGLPGDEHFPAEVIVDAFRDQFRERVAGSGYRSGGITFSAMVPVRHLPFRFIAVLGLNEGTFPGYDKAPGFDLIFSNPRPGDRQQRIQNRALFLDAVMAAKDRLHLSYTGFSSRDGSETAPSLVVSELVDQLAKQSENPQDMRRKMVIKHRLHGFHRDYLKGDGDGLFTYDSRRISEQQRLQSPSPDETGIPRFDCELPAQKDEDPPVLELAELQKIFRHPIEWMMRYRAGMALLRDEVETDDRDPFVMNALEKYKINQELLEVSVDDPDQYEAIRNQFRLSGKLPYSKAGSAAFDARMRDLEDFLKAIKAENISITRPDPEYAETIIMANGKPVLLRGRITPPVDGISAAIHYAGDKPKRRMDTWIGHLFMNATFWPEAKTIYITQSDKSGALIRELHPLNDPGFLSELVSLWLELSKLPPPATPQAMEHMYALLQAEADGDESKTASALGKLSNYFDPENSLWGASVYQDDNYAQLFFDGYNRGAVEDELRSWTQNIWTKAAAHFREREPQS